MKTLQIVLGHTRRGEFNIVARYCKGLVSQVLGPGRSGNGRSAWLSSRFHESSRYDIEHGVDTSGTARSDDDSQVNMAVAAHMGNYAPSRPSSFKLALSKLGELDFEEYTFVDLGSGKGRTLLLASEYRFNRIIGVEFSKALHEAALDNVRRYGRRSRESTRIECVCGDATTFALPAEPLVIYLFDPFQGEVLSRVVDNIEDSFERDARPVFIIFVGVSENALETLPDGGWGHGLLEGRSFLERLGSGTNFEDRYVVYRTQP